MGIHARHYDRNEWNRDMADNEIEARQEAFSMWATTWDVDGTGLPRGNVQTSASTSRWLPPVWVREPEGVGYDQGEQWIYDVMIWIQPPVVVVTGAERHRQAMVLLPLCDVVL